MSEAAKGSDRSPGFARNPDYRIEVTPAGRRVRVEAGGETVADSSRASVLREASYPPVYYFPREDVRMDLLQRSAHQTHCPYKGDASYWSITAGGREIADSVWSYEAPYREMAAIKDLVAFYDAKVDGILVEGEPGPAP